MASILYGITLRICNIIVYCNLVRYQSMAFSNFGMLHKIFVPANVHFGKRKRRSLQSVVTHVRGWTITSQRECHRVGRESWLPFFLERARLHAWPNSPHALPTSPRTPIISSHSYELFHSINIHSTAQDLRCQCLHTIIRIISWTYG